MAFSFLDQICKLTWAHGDAEATGNGNSNGCSITATNSEAEMRKSFRAHLAQSPTVRPVPVTCYPLFAAADSAAGFRSTTSASAERSFPAPRTPRIAWSSGKYPAARMAKIRRGAVAWTLPHWTRAPRPPTVRGGGGAAVWSREEAPMRSGAPFPDGPCHPAAACAEADRPRPAA